jgi:stearoyl-CoA desaturase (delta-9 desaturase)
MAPIVTTPAYELAPEVATPTAPHTEPPRLSVRMGRAATVGAGINWLTLIVMAVFHLGAVAALFYFTWQRLAVMLVLYVLAINVGIGMCYHRLLTHRG